MILALLIAQATPLHLSAALSYGAHVEQLEVGMLTESRALQSVMLTAALDYDITPRAMRFARLEGASRIGVGLVFVQGRFPLRIAQALQLVRPLVWKLSAVLGLQVGAQIDTAQPQLSFLELSLPVGARLGPLELLYVPRLLLPLGSVGAQALGAQRRKQVGVAFAPLMISLRYRFWGF